MTASRGSAPPPTLFIDRDTWSAKLGQALREAGIPFEPHRDHFDRDEIDPVWIRAVAARRWIIVTRDKAIRHRPAELAAVREGCAFLFALTSGNLSAADTAGVVVAAWPRICRAVEEHRPPALFAVHRDGSVVLLKR